MRNEIEQLILSQFAMEKLDKYNVDIFFRFPIPPNTSDEELDLIIYDEILAEAEHTEDMRNCFIEADIVSLDNPELSR